VSGRLSSSDPNLQNIPANSIYGKVIKEAFVGPKNWLFCGADFNSLEDYISALTTKDPNKLKVYIDGFDGHCLRAAYYFRDQCPDIDQTDPVSVNSMKKKYPELRQDSKGPTFALTYQGTHHTLVSNLGFEISKAKEIEKGYHEMYKVSDQYIQDRLHQATRDGFVTVAFGLRVRTPLLGQVVFNSPKMPYEAAAEGRTVGNAMGQSYGLLNNRAAVAFMQKVWASKYRLDILPVALIHDAIYILIKDDIAIVEWANYELIQAMQWQELPEIQHPTVKLGAALDIFWPSWAKATTLPNNASPEEIRTVCNVTKSEYPILTKKELL
jgi:DNA polymerase-1